MEERNLEYKSLEQLKAEYMETPIPPELDFLVRKTLHDGSVSQMKNRIKKRIGAAAAAVAVCAAVLTAGVNASPAFAATLSQIPVLDKVVKVLMFREYKVSEERFRADIKVPAVEGLENKALETGLNEKYLAENKALYETFMTEMENMKKDGAGNFAVDSGYLVKTDTDRILSIGRYVVVTMASGAETLQYDTIDKVNEILITLPSLFKDDSYIEVISENIKEQMRAQMQADEGLMFWVEMEGRETPPDAFDKIAAEQSFYISAEGKLVISFDEYAVAPGFMGIQEFVIPTEVIAELLISDTYVK